MDNAFLEGFDKVAKIRWATRVLPLAALGTAGALALSGTEGEAAKVVGKAADSAAKGITKSREAVVRGTGAVREYGKRKGKQLYDTVK